MSQRLVASGGSGWTSSDVRTIAASDVLAHPDDRLGLHRDEDRFGRGALFLRQTQFGRKVEHVPWTGMAVQLRGQRDLVSMVGAASAAAPGRGRVVIVVEQDALRRAVEVLVLAGPEAPQEGREAEQPANGDEHDRLGDQLTDDAPPAGAERAWGATSTSTARPRTPVCPPWRSGRAGEGRASARPRAPSRPSGTTARGRAGSWPGG